MKRISDNMSKAIYEVGYNQFDRLYDEEMHWGDGETDWLAEHDIDPDSYYEIHTFGRFEATSYEALIENLADSAYMDPEFRINKTHESTVELAYFVIFEAYGKDEADKYLDEILDLGYELNVEYRIPEVA